MMLTNQNSKYYSSKHYCRKYQRVASFKATGVSDSLSPCAFFPLPLSTSLVMQPRSASDDRSSTGQAHPSADLRLDSEFLRPSSSHHNATTSSTHSEIQRPYLFKRDSDRDSLDELERLYHLHSTPYIETATSVSPTGYLPASAAASFSRDHAHQQQQHHHQQQRFTSTHSSSAEQEPHVYAHPVPSLCQWRL
jgi:hypothetical protein